MRWLMAAAVRFSRRAVFVAGLHRGFGGMRGVFRSEVRCEMLLAVRVLRGFEDDFLVHLLKVASGHLKITHISLLNSKERTNFAERLDEGLRVFDRIVDAAGRAVGGIHAEVAVHRLRAVVSDADGDALRVDELADVVRVHAFDFERDASAVAASCVLHGHLQGRIET